jgi:hypothetical protein
MNKFQDVCLRATRSRSGSLTFHLAPDILRPLPPGDPVTLVTPPHTDQCDYCMCIRLVNKHNESKPFQCISDRDPQFA